VVKLRRATRPNLLDPSVRYPDGMDHLEVLREKIARLRAEIAQIQESNQVAPATGTTTAMARPSGACPPSLSR
jgi:hypothetical protein